MQRTLSFVLVVLCLLSCLGSALAQGSSKTHETSEKARVFITDSQSWEMSEASGGSAGGFGGARPQTAEIIKTFGEGCPEVLVNNTQEKSDYIVLIDHEGEKGVSQDRDKVAVFARLSKGSLVSKSTLSLGGSVQEACEAIHKAWVVQLMVNQAVREVAANRGHYGSGQGGDYGLSQGRSAAKEFDQAEILTDTMGVDFGPYLTRVVQIVKQNWYSVMPPSVYPPIFKQGKLAIELVILKDGMVSGMMLRTSSGDVPLDGAAWFSITTSAPFPPLPKEFPGQRIGLRLYYFYNLQPSKEDLRIAPSTDLRIAPSTDVRVPAGSNLQFSASGKSLTDAWVDWSVSGSGCSKSACGTISNSGLYTAPVDIPSPPTVIVEAKSWTNGPVLTVKATSRVNVSIIAKQATSH